MFLFDKTLQFLAPTGMAELPQRLGLDLSNPLPRHLEVLPDLFKSMITLFADTEAHPEDLFLPRSQGIKNPGSLLGEVGLDNRFQRGDDPFVFDEIPEV